MKRFLVFIGFVCAAMISSAQVNVDTNGNVGIKKNSGGYSLDVNGTLRINGLANWEASHLIIDQQVATGTFVHPTIRPSSDWYGSLGTATYRFGFLYCDHVKTRVLTETSDERLKTNIKDLDGAMPLLLKLRPVRFDWNASNFNVGDATLKRDLTEKGKNNIGFLAQEVQEVLPEIVNYEKSSDTYSIQYTALIPVLVEALKEQQAQIEDLRLQLKSLERCCDTYEKSIIITSNNSLENRTQVKGWLGQNIPNPFNERTIIPCNVPENSSRANITIFNMMGNQLKQITITGKGDQKIDVERDLFVPGIYLYSLVVDGKEIDTKKMILEY
jgi:hypothetical protein